MRNLFKRFLSNKSGATAIEYGLIGALISVSVIVGASQLGGSMGDIFQGHADKLEEINDKNGF